MTKRLLDIRTIAGWLIRATAVVLITLATGGTLAGTQAHAASSSQYTIQEIVDAGHDFFGSTSGGLAKVVENAFRQYGLPNGYILGQEGSGAFIAGLTYGEGNLYTKNVGQHGVFWQGPSLGLDYGGQGSRVMMLVYDLPSLPALYNRFGGVSGSAYVVAGVGMTVLKSHDVVIVPIRTGIGARLGINVGYLKLSEQPTWNPF
nr:EipA family protein [uncultured Gellertiella sp.]